jgi:hypothetical protein
LLQKTPYTQQQPADWEGYGFLLFKLDASSRLVVAVFASRYLFFLEYSKQHFLAYPTEEKYHTEGT